MPLLVFQRNYIRQTIVYTNRAQARRPARISALRYRPAPTPIPGPTTALATAPVATAPAAATPVPPATSGIPTLRPAQGEPEGGAPATAIPATEPPITEATAIPAPAERAQPLTVQEGAATPRSPVIFRTSPGENGMLDLHAIGLSAVWKTGTCLCLFD